MDTPLEQLPTRHSLLRRLKDLDDQATWQEFYDLYRHFIYGVAVKCGLTDAEAREVLQDTVLTVSKKIGDFEYRPEVGSFKSWLMSVTRWKITEQLRRRELSMEHGKRFLPLPPDPTATRLQSKEQFPVPPQLDALCEAEWKEHLLQMALARLKLEVNARHYQVFDCYVLRNWSIEQVTSAMEMNVAQVYLIKSRLSRLLRKEVRELERRLQ